MLNNMSLIEILKLFAPLIAINLMLIAFCLFRITKDKVKYLPKWAWALIIVFIEIVGPLSYLIIGRVRD